MEGRGTRLQDRTYQLLERCVRTTERRRDAYEQAEDNVFAQAARIYTDIFNSAVIVGDIDAQRILRVQFCMKLARYGMQVTRVKECQDNAVITDSLVDSNVYATLMEVERQMSNEEQKAKIS